MVVLSTIPTSTDEGDETCACVEVLDRCVPYLGHAANAREVYVSRPALHELLHAGAQLIESYDLFPPNASCEAEHGVSVRTARSILTAIVARHLGVDPLLEAWRESVNDELRVSLSMPVFALLHLTAGPPKRAKSALRTYLFNGSFLFQVRVVRGVLRIDIPGGYEN